MEGKTDLMLLTGELLLKVVEKCNFKQFLSMFFEKRYVTCMQEM